MNETNVSRAQADGFLLDILPNLTATKDNTGTGSLLDYLAMVYIDSFKSGILLSEELDLVSIASKTILENIDVDIRILEERFKQMQEKTLLVIPQQNAQIFTQVIPSFLEKVAMKLDEFKQRYENIIKEFIDTLSFFGYSDKDKGKMSIDAFYGIIDNFIKQFDLSKNKIDQKDKKSGTTDGPPILRGRIGEGTNALSELAAKIKQGGIAMTLKTVT